MDRNDHISGQGNIYFITRKRETVAIRDRVRFALIDHQRSETGILSLGK